MTLWRQKRLWFRLLKNWILRCEKTIWRTVCKDRKGVRQCIQTAFWRRKGNARIVRRRRHSRSGYSHYCTAAREKTAKYDAAFWWRKGADGHCTFVCYPNLKPSPFCLLDEIEAALDDSNVTRFAKYLHKLTKHTQFIVITHRRGTMTAADRLYGITMQEKGVSTLVSVNLLEDELEK